MATSAPSLASTLTSSPHTFLQPSASLHTSSLDFLKQTLDPLAESVAAEQQRRLDESRKKRKRNQHDSEDVLKLKRLHVDGFAIEQVWEQTRRVIDAARSEAEKGLKDYESRRAADADVIDGDELAGAQLGAESSAEEASELGEEGVDWDYDGEDGVLDEDGEDLDEDDIDMEIDLEDEDLEASDEDDEDALADEQPAQEYMPDPNGLNDGFFSIDDFNKQSDFLEQADARGDNDGAASDEEDVDWGSNPLGQGQGRELEDGSDDDDDEAETGGPTFGNVDLNAPDSESEDEDEDLEDGAMDGMDSMANTNNIKYADFFAPPAKKGSKNKRGRPMPHNFPAAQNPPADDKSREANEEEIQRTISAVHRDLFEDESGGDDGEDDEREPKQDLDPSDPRSRRSTHEKRRAALAEEIRRLEAANVAKREWTLSGEATAIERPQNSLLEEDLEFERAGKPVPVITAEVSESIESLIKRRILAQEFDDIIRRRPDDLATGRDARRGRFDFQLSDVKEKKSLAEMYEEEHSRLTDPNYVDEKDEKTRKEQNEILTMWKDVCGKLDSLSSWHFTPKAPAPQLDIRVDAPVVRLEDARPSAGIEAAGASQLAPQEVYRPGEGARKAEEVVTRGGGVVGREEMGKDEKKRRRRREKERIRKGSDNKDKKIASKGAEERKNIVGDLKKGNVRVIGKKGDLTNVAGKKVKDGEGRVAGAGSFKL